MSIEATLAAVDEGLAKRGYRVVPQAHTTRGYPMYALESTSVGFQAGELLLRRRPFLLDDECDEDLLVLKDDGHLPPIEGAMVVIGSNVNDEYERRQGLGTLMYERVLLDQARRGYAMAPDACDDGTTSQAARRVWEKLKNRGDVVVGVPLDEPNPRRSS